MRGEAPVPRIFEYELVKCYNCEGSAPILSQAVEGENAMKSRLISAVFDDRESNDARAFKRHVGEMIGLKEQDREACLEALPSIRLGTTRSERKRQSDSLAAALGITHHKVEHTLVVMLFFVDALLSRDVPDSDPPLWVDDLEELGCVDRAARPVLETVLARIRSVVVPQIQAEVRRRRAAGGVLPCLTGCGVTIEIRAVREDFYRWGTPIEDYEPHILDTVPVASIHIGMDEGMPSDFYFQADEDDLDQLINMLHAAKKDMRALQAHLKLDRSTER